MEMILCEEMIETNNASTPRARNEKKTSTIRDFTIRRDKCETNVLDN
jgi:hypothetical protein